MRKLLLAALPVVLSGLSLVAGDLTLTYKVTGHGAMAQEGTQVEYICPTRIRMNQEGTRTDTLIDYGKGEMYVISHDKKTITRMTFKDMEATMEAMNKQMGAVSNMMSRIMFGDVTKVKVEKEGTDTVLGHPCQKVRITIGRMVEDLSLDPDLQFPIRDYAKAMAMMTHAPGEMGTVFQRLYSEIGKLHGVPLQTHVKGLMGMEVTTTATAISTAPIPAGVWALPAGYQEVDGGKKALEGMR